MSLKQVQLGEVLRYEQPTKYIVHSPNYAGTEKDIPVLTAGKTFILGYTLERQGIFRSKSPVIIFDDFTTSSKLVDFPFKVKSSAMKILHVNDAIADARYLYYVMQNIKFPVRKHKRHWISEYSKLLINLPPLTQQKQIADSLENISKNINNGKKLINKQKGLSNLLYQSILSRTFSVDSFRAVYFSDDIFRINTKTCSSDNLPDNFTYIDIDAVKSGEIINPKKINKKNAPSRARRIVKEGDILIASVRPYLRSFAVVSKDYSGAIASTGFFVIDKSPSIDSHYLLHYILSDLFIEQTNKLMKGAQYPALNRELLNQIFVPLPFKDDRPDISIQKQIANKLDQVFQMSRSLKELATKQTVSFSDLHASALSAVLGPILKTPPAVVSSTQPVVDEISDLQQAIGFIIKRFPRGEMVVAKVLYLAQSIFKVPLEVSFTQQALGPYSFDIKTAVEDGLSAQKGIFIKKGTKGKEVLSLSVVGTNTVNQLSGGIKKPMEDYLNVMMPLYFSSQSNSIELLATICKIIEDEKTSDDQVIYQKLQKWKPKKFGDSEIYRTISLVKKQKWDQKILQV